MQKQLARYKEFLENSESMQALEAWEVMYLHEKAIRDCWFLMHDEVPPQDDKYGTLTSVPNRLTRKFIGKKFHELLAMTGHTTADFH